MNNEIQRRLIQCGLSRRNFTAKDAERARNRLEKLINKGHCLLIVELPNEIEAYLLPQLNINSVNWQKTS